LEPVIRRPVAIVLPGRSVLHLKSVHDELVARNFLWLTINRFVELQHAILPPGEHFSLLFCLAQGELETHKKLFLEHIRAYPDSRLIVRSEENYCWGSSLNHKTRQQIVSHNPGSGWPQPNSLLMLLDYLCCFHQPQTILLFGADGFIGDEKVMIESYINSDRLKLDLRVSNIMQDTIYFNKLIYHRLNKWFTCRPGPFPLIWNISNSSFLAGIPKLSVHTLLNDKSDETSSEAWLSSYQQECSIRNRLSAGDNNSLTLEQCAAYGLLDIATSKALHGLQSRGELSILEFRVLLLTESGTRSALDYIREKRLRHLKWAVDQLVPWLEQYEKNTPWTFSSDE
jgi:hypothetical protein